MSDIFLHEGDNLLDVALVPIPPPVANLSGVVTDADTGNPLPGVKVSINGQIAYTNASGMYDFVDLAPGSYTVIFEKDGYNTEIR